MPAALLFLFVLPTASIMHAYWKEADAMERANQQAHFLKKVALAGSALRLCADDSVDRDQRTSIY